MVSCRESSSYHINLLKEVAQIGTKKMAQAPATTCTAGLSSGCKPPAQQKPGARRQPQHSLGLGIKQRVAIFGKPDDTEVLQSWTCHCHPSAIFKIYLTSNI